MAYANYVKSLGKTQAMSHHSMVGDDPMMADAAEESTAGVPVGAVVLAAVLETEPLIE